MNERTYTLRIVGDSVTMSVPDFAHLSGELTNYGVEVKIVESTTSHVVFQLEESNGEH